MIMSSTIITHTLRPLVMMLLATAVVACGTDTAETTTTALGTVRGDTVLLTPQQRQTLHVNDAPVSMQQIATPLRVNGTVHVPPQYASSLSAPMGGTVRKIHVLPGQRVRAGEPVIGLEHRDFITLQQDYLTTESTLQAMESELTRQQRLADDNVNARKVLEQTTADVRNLRVKRKALAEQLALIDIDATKLTERSLTRMVTMRAPFSGFVTQVTARTGAFAQPNDVLVDMVDTDHMHIELTVFERDAMSIIEGQRMTVALINDKTPRGGHVHLVGREVGADRTVVVHGHFDTVDANIRPGTALTAEIETAPRTATVVPSSAIVTWQGASWVFSTTSTPGTYVRHTVTPGATIGTMTELTGPSATALQGQRVVVQGVSGLLGVIVNPAEE